MMKTTTPRYSQTQIPPISLGAALVMSQALLELIHELLHDLVDERPGAELYELGLLLEAHEAVRAGLSVGEVPFDHKAWHTCRCWSRPDGTGVQLHDRPLTAEQISKQLAAACVES